MEIEEAARDTADSEAGQDNQKESFTSKIKRTFGWKRKLIFEKERQDGSGEVTIELPAKHDGMIQSSDKDTTINISKKEEESNKHNDLDAAYIEVMTTLTTLFTPHYELSTENTVVEKAAIEEQMKCEPTEKIATAEAVCDIPVHNASYTWLHTQSCPPHMDISTALREEIRDFEKEYKEVQEIVKKDHIKKSITILLENSKSY